MNIDWCKRLLDEAPGDDCVVGRGEKRFFTFVQNDSGDGRFYGEWRKMAQL
jgi:hypothetical protein